MLTARSHGGDQPRGMIEIAHQRRTGGAADHALGWAPHVDVDQIGARILGKPRRLGHGFRLATGNLHGMRENAASLRAQKILASTPSCLAAGGLGEFAAGDHFRKGQSGAEFSRQPPHGEIGHAGHGRQKGGAVEKQIADDKAAEPRGVVARRRVSCVLAYLMCKIDHALILDRIFCAAMRKAQKIDLSANPGDMFWQATI